MIQTAEAFLAEKAQKTDLALNAYVDGWDAAPPKLIEVIRYSLFAGGKRFRPALALGAAELVSGDDAAAMPAACALEMVHTYSLIHDDLPAMDDDDLRRGKPTPHKVFGEALAILAGDGLLTMAFQVLDSAGNPDAIGELAQAAGVCGMAGGQVIDLESAGQDLPFDTLKRMHRMKTGALIRAAVRLGALLAGVQEAPLARLTRFSEDLGLAFQITDDILDITGNSAALGKPAGSDVAKDKPTYPAVLGLELAREHAQDAVTQALACLEGFGPEADAFRSLTRYLIERQH